MLLVCAIRQEKERGTIEHILNVPQRHICTKGLIPMELPMRGGRPWGQSLCHWKYVPKACGSRPFFVFLWFLVMRWVVSPCVFLPWCAPSPQRQNWSWIEISKTLSQNNPFIYYCCFLCFVHGKHVSHGTLKEIGGRPEGVGSLLPSCRS